MVADPIELERLRTEWAGVRQMLERMQLLVAGVFVPGAITVSGLRDVVYNLPLLLAFDVLREVLRQLKREDRFPSKASDLGPLLEDARSLPWLDWQAVRDGARRRNAVAHDGALFTIAECRTDIANVESQLVVWKIVI